MSLPFEHPWLLLALLAVPLLGLLRRRHLLAGVVPYAPLQLQAQPASRSRWRPISWLVGAEMLLLALVVIGLAGPYQQREVEILEGEGIDAMLVLDVSLSMLAEDFPPNRLEALRRIARDFVARAAGHRLGLVIFAKDTYVQSPMTTDFQGLAELLESVTVYTINQNQSGGTAIGDALLVAGDRLQKSRQEGRDQALILITDGESNAGLEPELAARWLREQGVRLYIIGIGGQTPVAVTFEGRAVGSGDAPYLAVLDDQRLEALARAADGRYFRALDADALAAIFGELARLERAPLASRILELRAPLGRWPALLALPLFLASLVLGGMVVRRPLA